MAALLTYEFIAADTQLNLELRGIPAAGRDSNPTISALTLEDVTPVPEPATATFGLLGLAGLVMRRRRAA